MMQVVQYYLRCDPIVTESSEGTSDGKQRCGRCEVSVKYLEDFGSILKSASVAGS